MKSILALFALLFVCWLSVNPATAQDIRVFEEVATFNIPLEQAVQNTGNLLRQNGYQVISSFDAGVPDGCSFGAHVLAVVDPSSNRNLMELNRKTAPYAMVNRVVLFEDEKGGHIAIVNPQSVYRTVFLDDPVANGLAGQHRMKLRNALGATLQDGFGQSRKEGHIGKTMGVMAGGPFDGKIESLVVEEGATLAEVANLIQQGFSSIQEKWGLEIAYRYDLVGEPGVIFGVTGREMESKSFSIVGAGSDDGRKNLQCPGTAYAASYPLEMVVTQKGNDVHVQIVSAMYRMKMYFEDAGKWAFMKNMGMPGSLAGEIKNRVEFSLTSLRTGS